MSVTSDFEPTRASRHHEPGRFWRFMRNEPLVHFILLAGLLFLAQAIWSGDDREVITVDRATQEFLVKQKQDLLLKPLSEEEKERVIESFIEDEMLVREARKRGFDDNSRIRRLLIQNMRFFIAKDLGKPSNEELRSFFEANADRFQSPPAITYDHVFFKDPEAIPAEALEKLKSGADHTTLGDFSLAFARQVPKATEKIILGWFGPKVGRQVLALEDGEWHGPFVSPQGGHFLRIAERIPSSRPDFAAAKNWIEAQWYFSQQREVLDEELAKIRKGYRIEVARPSGDGE